MFEAFLGETLIEGHDHINHNYSYLKDHYPLPDESIKKEYDALVGEMKNQMITFLQTDPVDATMSDWIYSYMLGVVINNHSSVEDRHYLLTMIHMDNLFDEIRLPEYKEIYQISKKWLGKNEEKRPPTMFGEPHVIKSIRLQTIDTYYH